MDQQDRFLRRRINDSEAGRSFFLDDNEINALDQLIVNGAGTWSRRKAVLNAHTLLEEKLVEIVSETGSGTSTTMVVRATARGEIVAMVLKINPEYCVSI